MGYEVFSRDSYVAAKRDYNIGRTHITRQAEELTRITGRPSEIVDPAINQIRRSLIRLNPENGKFKVTVGCPIDITVDCDTTGSMGGEVDAEMESLPNLYDMVSKVVPGMDPQLCLGIFGDCEDDIVYCRPQFEMTAGKIVEYLKEMSPQRGGAGNNGEDPQYAMFARAYLTETYINKIGLKGYYFVVTDEPMHHSLRRNQIERIFGDDVWEELKKTGYHGLKYELPAVEEVVRVLQEKTHAFALVLGFNDFGAKGVWREDFGINRTIVIPNTTVLPQVISAIIGLTEGTLELMEVENFLRENGLDDYDLKDTRLVEEISKVKIGAQLKLKKKLGRALPKAGDIFEKKSDLFPIETAEETAENQPEDASSMTWL